MAALAYFVPPVSGLIAFLTGRSESVRLHGLQAVLLGAAWPASLFVSSWISPRATQGVFVVYAVVWLTLIAGTALGKNPTLPGLGDLLRQAAARPPLD